MGDRPIEIVRRRFNDHIARKVETREHPALTLEAQKSPKIDVDSDIALDPKVVLAIVRRLCAGDDGSDDLAQRTLLAAMRRPPSTGLTVPGWISTVARNFQLQALRENERRRRRERRAARPEAIPAAADIAADEELKSRVKDALAALEAPYRTVVNLRFIDDLPPRAIAERTGEPIETVKSRLKRALMRLRSALGSDIGPPDARETPRGGS